MGKCVVEPIGELTADGVAGNSAEDGKGAGRRMLPVLVRLLTLPVLPTAFDTIVVIILCSSICSSDVTHFSQRIHPRKVAKLL